MKVSPREFDLIGKEQFCLAQKARRYKRTKFLIWLSTLLNIKMCLDYPPLYDYEEETPEMLEREEKEYKLAEEAYEIAQKRLPILQFIARLFNCKICLDRPYLLHYKNKDGEITPSGFRIR